MEKETRYGSKHPLRESPLENQRNGYQQAGDIPGLYRPGITEYLMAKNLKK